VTDLAAGLRGLRPFVPCNNFTASKAFYRDMGFSLRFENADLAIFELGAYSFVLQNRPWPGAEENFVVQLVVDDVAAWWARLGEADFAGRHGVRPPIAPARQPWGATVLHAFDPTGVLWQISQYG
jgi:catechol 2,3-dioxygenase-like lactoylglutathione lyase family enzyme